MSDWWPWLAAIVLCAVTIALAFRSARKAPLAPASRDEDAAPSASRPDSRTNETTNRP